MIKENFNFVDLGVDYAYDNYIGNLGDAIQSYAVANQLSRNGFTYSGMIGRDTMSYYAGKRQLDVVTNGWFRSIDKNFLMERNKWFSNEKIDYHFIGLHLAGNVTNFYDLKTQFGKGGFNERIGCRDKFTRDYLKLLGYKNAYVSLCNTLSFSDRVQNPETQTKIFLIDVNKENVSKEILESGNEIVERHALTNQNTRDWNSFKIVASTYLGEIISQAKLVVTSRLHMYYPCLAMNIPVLFLGNIDYRTEHIKVINSQNRTEIKELIQKNFDYQIFGKGEDVSEELDKISCHGL